MSSDIKRKLNKAAVLALVLVMSCASVFACMPSLAYAVTDAENAAALEAVTEEAVEATAEVAEGEESLALAASVEPEIANLVSKINAIESDMTYVPYQEAYTITYPKDEQGRAPLYCEIYYGVLVDTVWSTDYDTLDEFYEAAEERRHYWAYHYKEYTGDYTNYLGRYVYLRSLTREMPAVEAHYEYNGTQYSSVEDAQAALDDYKAQLSTANAKYGYSSKGVTKKATCAATGTETYTSSSTGATYTLTIPKTSAHTWGEWKTTRAATYTAKGIEARTCSVCGTKETQYIDKLIPVTMYRLYNPYSGEHLYTADGSEKGILMSRGWEYEGVAWKAPSQSNTPVYRLYNKYSGDHHFTTNKSEYDACVAQGWNGEGIGFYSDDAKGVTVYRLYNKYLTQGTHHYTTSKTEYDSLGKIGWSQENIGWYGLKS